MPGQVEYLYEEDFYEADELSAEDVQALFAQERDVPADEFTQADPDREWLDALVISALKARDSLRNLQDDELVGTLPILRSITAQATARELAVTQELIRRRKPAKWDTGTEEVTGIAREAVEEVALALTLTKYAAQSQAQLAMNLRDRLPATFAQMTAGKVDTARVRVIAEATSLMDPEVARKIDREIAGKAAEMTTGKLRDELRRLEIKADLKSAEKRRERAERRARVRLYPDSDFTAALNGESLPADLAAAAFARIAAIASAWKSAGVKEPVGLLQAKVFLGLLLGTLGVVPPPAGGEPPENGPESGPGPEGGPGPETGPEPEGGPDSKFDTDGGDAEPAEPEAAPWPAVPGTSAAGAPGCARLPGELVIKPGRLKLTAAWRTLAGTGPEPGYLSRLGPITPAQAARLAAAAALDPTATWTVVVTDDDGHAVAVTTLRSPNAATTKPGMIGEVTVSIPAALADKQVPEGSSDVVMAAKLAAVVRAAARVRRRDPGAECAHTDEAKGYRIPDTMRRWVSARDRTCYNPVCRQPASRCDQDHTLAYHKGGRTCPCNLGSACRAHHQLKQLPGWDLIQDKPGYFTLRTRAGLSYMKTPDPYPV